MTDVSVKLKDDVLEAAMRKTILAALDDIGREAIVREVVKHLVTDTSGNYGERHPSPLRKIMYDAAGAVARALITDQLNNDPEFQAKVKEIYAQAAEKFFSVENRPKLIEKIARGMERSLGEEKYT